MASKKNRSRKVNGRSPNALKRLYGHCAAWLARQRGYAIAAGIMLLFATGLVGGYIIADWLSVPEPQPKYARIDDIPDLPKYTEVEPGKPRPTIEEKPRNASVAPRPPPSAIPSEAVWRRNAMAFRDLSRPLIAIVIDDVGLDRPRSRRAWELPGPLTLAFLPYARDLRDQARTARERGHELMLHLPMEPTGRNDPGPNALLVSLSDAELRHRTVQALDSFDGYVGVNNHMGSRFTAFRPGMDTVLRQLKARGLMFIDSRTTTQSIAEQAAHELGVPSLVRHVFLDDEETLDAVRRKLAETEAIARRQGFVVAIGHPHEATLQALHEWLPGLAAKGFALAPATAVLRKRNGWD